MGFLLMLLVMCAWMLYGGTIFYEHVCNVNYEDGLWAALLIVNSCTPWIGWVMANSLLHFIWVAILTVCQLYQITWLGMTTNERMNRGRYRHFMALGGKSPFDHGVCKNLLEFLEWDCFGCIKRLKRDWLTVFDYDSDKGDDTEPLMRATDNYQYV